MIQFNLLPDVKLNFIKAQRTKHITITVSILCSIIAVAILVILLVIVDGLQKKSLNDLNKDTAKYSAQITNTPQLNKVLTIQNQLGSLPTLDSQKPAIGRLFNYLSQTTPQKASIDQITVDLTQNTWAISGTADSYTTINQFVDTYKFTTYKTSTSSANANAFTGVVLGSFGKSNDTVSYEITLSFAPDIFKASQNITMNVPNIVSTRSETQQPQLLFNKQSN